jgi:hypothetical protein
MTISRHPEPCTDPHPYTGESGARESSFRSSGTPDGFTRREPRRPRPLFTRPCRSFWSAFAELIRDQTSPADFCNILRRASNQTRALDPRRDGGLDLLAFLTCHAASLERAMDTRRAALRPFMMAPVLVLPACAGLPNRDATTSAPPPSFRSMHSED